MVGFIVTLFLAKVSSLFDSAIRLRSANFAIGSLVANHGPYEENKPVTSFGATNRRGRGGGERGRLHLLPRFKSFFRLRGAVFLRLKRLIISPVESQRRYF